MKTKITLDNSFWVTLSIKLKIIPNFSGTESFLTQVVETEEKKCKLYSNQVDCLSTDCVGRNRW